MGETILTLAEELVQLTEGGIWLEQAELRTLSLSSSFLQFACHGECGMCRASLARFLVPASEAIVKGTVLVARESRLHFLNGLCQFALSSVCVSQCSTCFARARIRLERRLQIIDRLLWFS